KQGYYLQGKILNYNWGGISYISQFLNFPITPNTRYAEYWLGAHISNPSNCSISNQQFPLNAIIKNNPWILKNNQTSYTDELPFLLKLLDVQQMLSIQLHPNKLQAEQGFEKENNKQIPLNAYNRTYKDNNHKPEMLISLNNEFWLLHGFKKKQLILQDFNQYPIFNNLAAILQVKGIPAFFEYIMLANQTEIDFYLMPFLDQIKLNNFNKSQPAYWIQKYLSFNPQKMNIDRSLFCIFLLNIVCVPYKKAIFQHAGIPHAYLEGQNIEIMGNSDNVIRGGLTEKYIDITALLTLINYNEIEPEIFSYFEQEKGVQIYPSKCGDFGIDWLDFSHVDILHFTADSITIFLVLSGEGNFNNQFNFKKGASFFVPAGTKYSIKANNSTNIIKSYIPINEN
ncbi:MAG: mannose-6-phosphate isomerase, class I, partial [Sediminibacterium sp.]|nr:mannose-6-phosphate isomerase, class I [Sediminibacterium sp.]